VCLPVRKRKTKRDGNRGRESECNRKTKGEDKNKKNERENVCARVMDGWEFVCGCKYMCM